MSLARDVIMVRATHFCANPETRASNAFQHGGDDAGAARAALGEQEALASALEKAGVAVLMLEPPSASPDGVFPNNGFSTHEQGELVLYPMAVPSRRAERFPALDDTLRRSGYIVTRVHDYAVGASAALEGTGSLVLDRAARVAYACASVRTDRALAQSWARQMGYALQWFSATDPEGAPVYHTNVIMSVGAGLAIVCLESIRSPDERAALRERLEATNIRVLEIDWRQVCAFAGNQLFLEGRDGPVVALSAAANRSLREDQRALLDRHAERVIVDVATIERFGGGGVRCMLAENFLPRAAR